MRILLVASLAGVADCLPVLCQVLPAILETAPGLTTVLEAAPGLPAILETAPGLTTVLEAAPGL